MLKLLIVDDHAIFREGLRTLLDMEEDFQVIGEASRGDEAVAMVAEEPPDVVLLDLHLPDGSGADFCRDLLDARKRRPLRLKAAQVLVYPCRFESPRRAHGFQ